MQTENSCVGNLQFDLDVMKSCASDVAHEQDRFFFVGQVCGENFTRNGLASAAQLVAQFVQFASCLVNFDGEDFNA